MRHRVAGRQLSRTTSHRKALRRNLAAALIEHGAIRTTEAKAKELRRFVEKLITVAKQGTLHARRRVFALLRDRPMSDEEGEAANQTVLRQLFDVIAPRYADRPGGYTRIIRIPDRRIGDAGTQVVLQLVEEAAPGEGIEARGGGRRRRRAAKRRQAASQSIEEPSAAQQPGPPPQDEGPGEAPEDGETSD
jgi:large subunit ribosomal protein L17